MSHWNRAIGPFVLSCFLLGGCASDQSISKTAIDYNRSVERESNAQILLNILRSRDRSPMHFTSISQVRGNYKVTTTSTLGVEIPVGGDAESLFPISPTLQLQEASNPTFDVAVLNTKEFGQGILDPVDVIVAEYFWQRRWPQDLLLYLLIDKVDVLEAEAPDARPDKVTTTVTDTLSNRMPFDPNRSKAGFEKFQRWVDDMQARDIVIDMTTTGRAVGPPIDIGDEDKKAALLKQLVEAEKQSLQLVEINDKFQLCKIEQTATFCLNKRCDAPKLEQACSQPEKKQETGIRTFQFEVIPSIKDGKPVTTTRKYRIYLRSVDAILYYLGEILRVQEKNFIPMGKVGRRRAITKPLFIVKAGEPPENALVSVEHAGSKHYIDNDSDSEFARTTLALLTHLLRLQRTSEDQPKTTAVEVVGQ